MLNYTFCCIIHFFHQSCTKVSYKYLILYTDSFLFSLLVVIKKILFIFNPFIIVVINNVRMYVSINNCLCLYPYTRVVFTFEHIFLAILCSAENVFRAFCVAWKHYCLVYDVNGGHEMTSAWLPSILIMFTHNFYFKGELAPHGT